MALKTSAVLRKAGDVLRERGWCQGGFTELEGGNGGVCVFGAANVATTGDACDGSLSRESMNVVRKIVRKWPPHWNDERSRTAAEVMHALDAAFVLALQEEGIEPEDVLK